MNEFRLAERVAALCPEVMGMCRTAQQVVRDPRVVEALVKRLESNYPCPCPDGCNGCELPGWAKDALEAKDRRVEELKAENERLWDVVKFAAEQTCVGFERECVHCEALILLREQANEAENSQ